MTPIAPEGFFPDITTSIKIPNSTKGNVSDIYSNGNNITCMYAIPKLIIGNYITLYFESL